jgi:hypothetical protein
MHGSTWVCTHTQLSRARVYTHSCPALGRKSSLLKFSTLCVHTHTRALNLVGPIWYEQTSMKYIFIPLTRLPTRRSACFGELLNLVIYYVQCPPLPPVTPLPLACQASHLSGLTARAAARPGKTSMLTMLKSCIKAHNSAFLSWILLLNMG